MLGHLKNTNKLNFEERKHQMLKRFKIHNVIILSVTALILQACGSGRTLVLDPVRNPQQSGGIRICSTQPSTEVPEEIKNTFDELLREKLYKEEGVKEGPETTLNYRFIQMNEGSRFKRWFLGGLGNSGEGTLTTEVTYLDKNNNVIGKIHTEGKIGSGMFGGGFSNAIETAVDQIAQYTLETLKPEIKK
jgi:hypothetical protein